jgi:hypothetical protein
MPDNVNIFSYKMIFLPQMRLDVSVKSLNERIENQKMIKKHKARKLQAIVNAAFGKKTFAFERRSFICTKA